MLVKAKCISTAWDSVTATRYDPGAGPLPDGLYEIESNGPLALLTLGKDFLFEFDRQSPADSAKPTQPVKPTEPVKQEVNLTCQCGKVCKSPFGLRLHKEKAHNKPKSTNAEEGVRAGV